MKSNSSGKNNSQPVQDEFINLSEVVDEAIRYQHPEWIEPDGTCPRCASYVHELADELDGRTTGHSS